MQTRDGVRRSLGAFKFRHGSGRFHTVATSYVSPESTPTMNKRQLIDEIRGRNPTAQEDFLEQFSEQDLREYLASLEAAQAKLLRAQADVPGPLRLAS
jgi:hypothetical protein